LIVTELKTLTKKRLLIIAGAFYGENFILPSFLLPNLEMFSVVKGNR